MKKLLALLLITATALPSPAQQAWPDVTPEMRPGTRWWWHGSAVEQGRLDTLITQYAQAGIGTVEITPIYGVQGNQSHNLSYLTTPWMLALNATQTAAKRNGLDVDMNGGTGWPFGGPTVKQGEAAATLLHKAEMITVSGTSETTWDVTAPSYPATLQCVMAYQGEKSVDLTSLVTGNTLRWTPESEGQWQMVAIWCGRTLQQVKRAAPGGEGYVVDHYDSTAVSNYLQRFDKAFQRGEATWPHSFFCDSYEVYGADWTPRFLEQFQRLRGYDLRLALPQLLGLTKDSVAVQSVALPTQQTEQRLAPTDVLADYRQTLSDLLLNSFTLPWTHWAHSHGVTTRLQAHGVPGSLLDFYAAADIPEIEGFGLTDFGLPGLRQDPGFTRQNYSDFATLKYASSAAHVTGKCLTSSETFTWLTEHFRTSLSQMKPDLDLMFAAGVNHIFFHGTAYTPDTASAQPAAQWPGWHFYASIDMSPGNSIWRDAPAMMQYATRCQSWLQQGQPDNDFLLYANFREAMHKNTGTFKDRLLLFDINTLSQKMPSVVSAQRAIEQAGYDCDYISDQQLLRLRYEAGLSGNSGDSGMLVTEGGTRYKALLITSDRYMPANVRQHLDSLVTQGARIVISPTLTQASLDTLGATPDPQRLAGMKVLRRRLDDGRAIRFITNLTDESYEGVLSAHATLYDAMTGSISPAGHTLQLRPGQSTIAAETGDSGESGQPEENKLVKTGTPIIISGPWTLSFTEGTPAICETYLLDTLRTWEGLSEETARYMGTGVYETTFTLSEAQITAAPMCFRLDLGNVRESARIYINGDSIGTLWAVPFTLDIPYDASQGRGAALHAGKNTLRIEVTNLPANRIAAMDREDVTWRLFEDVNMLGIVSGNEGSRVESYASWQVMPSGLASNVTLMPLQTAGSLKDTRLYNMVQMADSLWWPVYSFRIPKGNVTKTTLTDLSGNPLELKAWVSYDTLYALPMVADASLEYGILTVNLVGNGVESDLTWQQSDFIPLRGAYHQLLSQRFDGTEPPATGWNNAIKNGFEIAGFAGEGRVEAHVAKANGKEVTTLYDGLTFTSAMSNNFYLYPGYGMQPLRTCMMAATTGDGRLKEGDVMLLYHRVGDVNVSMMKLEDVPTDVATVTCTYAPDGLSLKMRIRTDGVLYQSAELYRPVHPMPSTEIKTPTEGIAKDNSARWYTLQGRAITTPTRSGLYIRGGKKIIVR